MKNSVRVSALVLPLIITAALVGQAQRGNRGTGRERQDQSSNRGNGNSTPRISNRENNTNRQVEVFRQPSPGESERRSGRNERTSSVNQWNNNNNPGIRDRNFGQENRNPGQQNRYPGNSYDNRNNNYNGYRNNRNYSQQPRYYGGGNHYRPFIAPRYTIGAPYFGQRFSSINHSFINIGFGGCNYNYYGGAFYRPFGGYYQVVAPPRGIHISLLPVGYHRFNVGPDPYYYYNGIFYNQPSNDYYEVVDPPLGARLPELPSGAKKVIINSQEYFENDGTYYEQEYNQNNEVLYAVVGTHGVLNSDQVAEVDRNNDSDIYHKNDSGTIVNALPANCKLVDINGQKLYMSPANEYYQQVVADDGTVSYQLVSNKQ
ncbi:MAG: DUF6515 family protein [Chitinophagaceae bacterium]